METKTRQFNKLKNELQWVCTEDGNVYNKKGRLIGYNHNGYRASKSKFDGVYKRVYLHQYIWWYFTGEISNCIDHINNDKSDNRLENLRNVTLQQNQFNRKNTRGYHKVRNKWRAMIRVNWKLIHLGYFFTENEAKQAYLTAKNKFHTYD